MRIWVGEGFSASRRKERFRCTSLDDAPIFVVGTRPSFAYAEDLLRGMPVEIDEIHVRK